MPNLRLLLTLVDVSLLIRIKKKKRHENYCLKLRKYSILSVLLDSLPAFRGLQQAQGLVFQELAKNSILQKLNLNKHGKKTKQHS